MGKENRKAKGERSAAEKSASAFSAISPLLGLGGMLGTSIPSLKKPPKSNVRVSAAPIAQAAMGTAAQGHGVGRGGAVLQGMRTAGRAGQMVASQSLQAQSHNEQVNINNELARRERLATFGRDTADGVSGLAVGLIDSANARKAERDAASTANAELLGTLGDPNVLPQPGAPNPLGSGDISGAYGGQGDAGVDTQPPPLDDIINNPEVQQGQAIASLAAELEGLNNQQITNRTEAFELSRAMNGMRPLTGMNSIAPDLEYRNRMINFGIDELDRRGLSLLNGLAPMARAMGTDLTQLMNPPMQTFFDEEEEASG